MAREQDLYQAVSKGEIDTVRELLDTGDIDINIWIDRKLPTHVACWNNRIDILKLLVESGFDINAPQSIDDWHDRYRNCFEAISPWTGLIMGFTPLSIACHTGETSLAEYLLTLDNININAKNYNNDSTSLMVACYKGHIDIVDLLLARNEIDLTGSLFAGCFPTRIDAVQRILYSEKHQHAMIDAPNHRGQTPMSSASSNSLDIVDHLIMWGADLNRRDHLGISPLISAIRSRNVDITERLLTSGADINQADDAGMTPLMYAIKGKNMALIDTVLNYHPEVDTNNENGENALSLARKHCLDVCPEIIEKLQILSNHSNEHNTGSSSSSSSSIEGNPVQSAHHQLGFFTNSNESGESDNACSSIQPS